MVLSLPGAAHGAVTRPGERGGVLDELDVRAGFSGEVVCASGFNALALASFSCSPRGLSSPTGMRVGGFAVGSEEGRPTCSSFCNSSGVFCCEARLAQGAAMLAAAASARAPRMRIYLNAGGALQGVGRHRVRPRIP
jgi:hypothetical protein